MSDIAQLGLQIDSSQAVSASTNLDKLAKAAQGTQTSLAAMQTSATAGGKSLASMVPSNVTQNLEATSTSLRGQRQVLRAIATDLSVFGTGMGQTAAMAGLFYVENMHLVEGMGGLKSAIAEVLTPQNLLAGGLIALGVGAFEAYKNWKEFALALEDASRIMGTTSEKASALQAAAGFQGISAADFQKGSSGLSGQLYQAQSGAGSLAELLRANNQQAGDFESTLEKVADLIKNAASDQQRLAILQQSGLPATMEWVRLLENGADGIKQAVAEATAFGGAVNDEMVARARDFDDAWNRSWTNFGLQSKTAVVSTMSVFDSLTTALNRRLVLLGVNVGKNLLSTGQGTPLRSNFDSFYGSFGNTFSNTGTAGTDKTVDPRTQQQDLDRESQHISLLGNLATVTDTVRAKQIELDQAFNKTGVSLGDQRDKLLQYTEASALGTLQIRQQADSFNIEAAAVGMSTGAAAGFRAEQEKLADFRARGITLTNDQTAALHAEAQALATAAQGAATLRLQSDTNFTTSQLGRSDYDAQAANSLRALYGDDLQSHMNDALATQIKMNAALTDMKSTASDALSTFAKDLRDGKSAADSLSDAMTKFEDKLIDIGSNQIVSGFLGSLTTGGTTGGGLSGFLSGIFGGTHHTGYGPGDPISGRYVSPAYFANAPRFHTGIGPGERPAIIRNDELVLTPGQMSQLAPAGQGGGGVTVNVNNAPAGTTATATATRDGTSGQMKLDVWLARTVDDVSAASITSGQSSMNTAIERRYGLSPKL